MQKNFSKKHIIPERGCCCHDCRIHARVPEPPQCLHDTLLLPAALFTYLVLGSILCIKTPLWFGPDEELHVAYCQYIARNKSLPEANITVRKEPVVMAFHPPLYYIAGSVFFKAGAEPVEDIVRINDGPGYALLSGGAETGPFARGVYQLRFFTLLCGVLIILAAYAAGWMLFPHTVLPASDGGFFCRSQPPIFTCRHRRIQ